MEKERAYLAIDLKSYFASCECTSRELDPLTTNLVVADESRTAKTICLAVSPSLKAHGISGRPRLFEVIQAVEKINAQRLHTLRTITKNPKAAFTSSSYDANVLERDPAAKLDYIVAPPRMKRYIETSAEIYSVYLKFVAPEDIFSYSIDEVFIDITAYLHSSRMTARELCMAMIREVLTTTGITATAGIGTNLYLAKVAMDIVAKRVPPDENGVRIAELDEYSYKANLWGHRPLTDFWRIGGATAKKLEEHYLYTMGDVARETLDNPEWFYRTFGVDAELLMDHAWGVEPVTMEYVQNYKAEEHSISEGQVLSEPYPYEKARIIIQEMADCLVLQLIEKELITDRITMDIGYDIENCSKGYRGETKSDYYGRKVPKPAHGSCRLNAPTNLGSVITEAALGIFDRIADPKLTIRRITMAAGHVEPNEGVAQLSMFADTKQQEREQHLQSAVASLKRRFGKNAVLKGTNYLDGATMRDRNRQIGGHKSGE